jgi:colicin import membrane protein
LKTLYGILGVGPEATAEQIEHAYARYSAMLQNDAGGLSGEELNNQKVALNDAYRTLSNPILRQRYDQKLADADFVRQNVREDFTYSESRGSFFSLKSLALLGVIALTGLYFYNQNIKEREKLRIQHEHEVQMKAVQVFEDQQRQNAKVQDVILEKSSAYSESQQLRQSQQQFERESLQAQQLDNQRRQIEMQQQQQARRDEENRLRMEQQRHQQQLQSDKRALQQMELNRYGKIITY